MKVVASAEHSQQSGLPEEFSVDAENRERFMQQGVMC